ncbi:DNA translocase FtsK [Streptococcus sp. SGI.013]|uniref:DNA translocase FtsK n=1 Tax=unclassified Streptococcus TaxID=2608887 RepID=UPI003D07F261
MSTKKKSSRKTTKKKMTKEEKIRQKALQRFLLTLGLSLILFFALFQLGVFGVTVYNIIRFLVGSLAYPFMLWLGVYLYGFKLFRKHESLLLASLLTFLGLLLIYHAYFFALEQNRDQDIFTTTAYVIMDDLAHFTVKSFAGGGMLGALLYKPVSFLFSNVGSFIIGGLLLLLGVFALFPVDIYDANLWLVEKWQSYLARRELRKQERFIKREEKEAKRAEKAAQLLQEKEELEQEQRLARVDMETGEILDEPVKEEPVRVEPEIVSYDLEGLEDTMPPEDFAQVPQLEPVDERDGHDVEVDFTPKQHLLYHLPSIDLFAPDKPKNQSKEKKLVRENIRVLEETFNSFGIKATVERAEIGPSVTKYEVKPAVGVRVNRISNLADDLALALAAKDVRIEAPIPGKSLVGIEVPNSEIATVSFRELWEQSKTDPNKLLEVPLGKAVNGTSRSFDLARMPHLLVAGSTGSGKSVAVNGIISSILMKARPDQVKFMMIDPKMVELSVYNDIPHLLIPVVTNPRKASKALQKVVDEMENRYELFSHFGVRNIAGYNAKVEDFNAQSETKHIPLPLLVVIVDELADLMMVASKEVEDAIIRLGQKARAAGIHMILATQRPSVDVISGLIKANVPSRIAFAVSSGTDSRTILDENGAEKLLGRGDMLFKPIDENHPVRLQGSFISDDDVERIVGFIKNQAEADYDDSFDPGDVPDTDTGGGSSSEGDPLFEEAKNLVLETQKASASMLQRRLSVGFNRATRLMEELEEAGVIGPAEGTKPRKVLMTK